MFKNPNIKYKKNEKTTYVSHNKGFLVAYIEEFSLAIVTGHCLPFHKFKTNPLDYLYVFKNMDSKLLNVIENNINTVITGDMNYTDIEKLFPQVINLTNKTICGITHDDFQADHILISKNIKNINSNIIDTRFNHKICITEIEL